MADKKKKSGCLIVMALSAAVMIGFTGTLLYAYNSDNYPYFTKWVDLKRGTGIEEHENADVELETDFVIDLELKPEPEPVPEPVVFVPELEPDLDPERGLPPKPTIISMAGLARSNRLWPEKLKLVEPLSLKARFKKSVGGEAIFHINSVFKVYRIYEDGSIKGRLMGIDMILPLAKTNLLEWFESTHSHKHILTPPAPGAPPAIVELTPEGNAKFYVAFDAWCLRFTRAKKITIGDEAIIAEVEVPKETASAQKERGWRSTAEAIAKAYVIQYKKVGGTDNYAICNVVDMKTGTILANASFLIP